MCPSNPFHNFLTSTLAVLLRSLWAPKLQPSGQNSKIPPRLHSPGCIHLYNPSTQVGVESGTVVGWPLPQLGYIICFPGGSDGKESACSVGDAGSTTGSGRSPGEGNGYPLQYSCLENPKDRGAWQAIVLGVAKSWP